MRPRQYLPRKESEILSSFNDWVGFNEAAAVLAAERSADPLAHTLFFEASMRPRQYLPRKGDEVGGYLDTLADELQ